MRVWSIDLFLLNDAGEELEANIFNKVTYNLHPSFANPTQTFTKPPFHCKNEGWGEFDMTIDLHAVEKGGKHTIPHDLNFAQSKYESKHTITFKNPNANLLEILRRSGPVPEEGGKKKAAAEEAKKRKKSGVVDMERLAEGLVKLQEDDLLQVVQMIHDNKSDETYTKNNAEGKILEVTTTTAVAVSLSSEGDINPTPVSPIVGFGRTKSGRQRKLPARYATPGLGSPALATRSRSASVTPAVLVSTSDFISAVGGVKVETLEAKQNVATDRPSTPVSGAAPRDPSAAPSSPRTPKIRFKKLIPPPELPEYPMPPPRMWPRRKLPDPKMPYEDQNTNNETTTEGEFHVDLYTLPDPLVRMLWDFVQSKS
jgi:transcription initiation factor IIF auxiliary subunit